MLLSVRTTRGHCPLCRMLINPNACPLHTQMHAAKHTEEKLKALLVGLGVSVPPVIDANTTSRSFEAYQVRKLFFTYILSPSMAGLITLKQLRELELQAKQDEAIYSA